jgi:uncharacterized protein (DUF302 family)
MPRLIAILLLAFAVSVQAADGLMSRNSAHGVDETYRRLVSAIGAAGMKIMLEVDHAANARAVGTDLQPAKVVVFGNPKIGSALMRCGQTITIDLPQRMLVWQDEDGQVKVGYNAPTYLAKRHGVEGCKAELDKVGAALERLIGAATRRD